MDISSEGDRRLINAMFPSSEDDFGNSVASEPRYVQPSGSAPREFVPTEGLRDRRSSGGSSFSARGYRSDSSSTAADAGQWERCEPVLPMPPEPQFRMAGSRLKSLPPHAGCQTGPKGVLADYQWLHHCKNEFNVCHTLLSMTASPQHNRNTATSSEHTLHGSENENENICGFGTLGELVGDLADLDIDCDPDFFESYRRRRMLEMAEANERPVHSAFREIGSSQFLKEVDCAHPRTPVIVHLFLPGIAECNLLDRHLTRLAAKYGYAKFVRMNMAKCSDLRLDPVALPVLQLYKAQNLILNIVRVGDEIQKQSISFSLAARSSSRDWDYESCESFLLTTGFLQEGDECSDTPNKSTRLLATVDESDEDRA